MRGERARFHGPCSDSGPLALWGIAGAYLADTAALSAAGTAASILLFAVSGPTRSRIAGIEEQLRASGSSFSLIEALDRHGGAT